MCEASGTYEFLTSDFVNLLAKYLIDRVELLQRAQLKKKVVKILEVGAGDGRLTYFLREAMADLPHVDIMATDLRKNATPEAETSRCFAPVYSFGYREALEKFRPNIVICSWMPMGIDWTASFREQTNVSEYVLIGETDWGVCGHPLKTWGMRVPGSSTGHDVCPSYEVDGFHRVPLGDVSDVQLSRYDGALFWGNSRTVSFQRKSGVR